MTAAELDTDALIALVDHNVRQLVSMSLELQGIVEQLRDQANNIEAEEELHDAS